MPGSWRRTRVQSPSDSKADCYSTGGDVAGVLPDPAELQKSITKEVLR
jgi:hypothetical protein